MRRLSAGGERGVSLTEALVALAILGFVGVTLVAGIYTTIQGNTIARINMSAESLARYELEYVKSVSDNWTNITKATAPWHYTLPGGPYPAWDSSHNSLPSGYTGYTITVNGNVLGGSYDTNIQQVTATVTYSSKQEAQIAEYIP
ncbi:MAG: type II secretion system protein [Dehalococcoidia bacterium]|jgi:Tfp pilus assembly protein PilV